MVVENSENINILVILVLLVILIFVFCQCSFFAELSIKLGYNWLEVIDRNRGLNIHLNKWIEWNYLGEKGIRDASITCNSS
jgi:hypothetical protein